MRLILSLIILLNIFSNVLSNNIKDLDLRAGSRGLALAIEMESSEKVVFSARGIAKGFEVAIKNTASNLSLTEFTDFGSNSPLKSISIVKKNGNVLIKGILKKGTASSPVTKMTGSRLLVLANKISYPQMSWRASEYDYDSEEDASFAVSEETKVVKEKEPKVVASDIKAESSKPAVESKVVDKPVIAKKVSVPVEPAFDEEAASGIVETTKGGVNFRSEPASKGRANIIAVLEKGVQGELLSRSGDWLKIKTTRSGKVGWVHNGLVSLRSADVMDDPEVEVDVDKKSNPVVAASSTKNAIKEKVVSEKPTIRKYRVFGRDPFLPLDKCDFLLPDLPNVEEATLVGIIYDNMDRIALIETKGKDGVESHTLRENTTVFNGRVLKIKESEVVFLISEAMYSRQFVMKMKEKIED